MKRAWNAFRAWWGKHAVAFILGWWLCDMVRTYVPKTTVEADPDILRYTYWALGIVFVGWIASWWLFVEQPWRKKGRLSCPPRLKDSG